MQFTTNTFRADSGREMGRAFRALVCRVRDEDAVQSMRIVSPPPNSYVGADVCTLPPGVVLIRQYDVQRDEWLGRFSLWYEAAV